MNEELEYRMRWDEKTQGWVIFSLTSLWESRTYDRFDEAYPLLYNLNGGNEPF